MYRIVSDDTVLLIEENKFIPFDVNNRDYLIYLNWLRGGNIPEPPIATPDEQKSLTLIEEAVILLLKLSNPLDSADIYTKNDLLNKLNTK